MRHFLRVEHNKVAAWPETFTGAVRHMRSKPVDSCEMKLLTFGHVLRVAASAAALALAFPVAAQTTSTSPGQAYPTKTVRIVAAFPAGTGVDITARIIAAKLGEAFSQQFVVDNRAGAGGNIAAELVAKSAPDGYTLLYTNNAHTINPNLYRSIPYDSVKDFEPVSLAGTSAMIMVAHPSLPATSVKDVIALAKARPGQINIASAGSGSPSHLGGALFKYLAKIDVLHVP